MLGINIYIDTQQKKKLVTEILYTLLFKQNICSLVLFAVCSWHYNGMLYIRSIRFLKLLGLDYLQ